MGCSPRNMRSERTKSHGSIDTVPICGSRWRIRRIWRVHPMPPACAITKLQRNRLFAVPVPPDVAPPNIVETFRRVILVLPLPEIVSLVLSVGVSCRRQSIVSPESLRIEIRPSRPSGARKLPGFVESADMHVRPFSCQDVLDGPERALTLPVVRPDPAVALFGLHTSMSVSLTVKRPYEVRQRRAVLYCTKPTSPQTDILILLRRPFPKYLSLSSNQQSPQPITCSVHLPTGPSSSEPRVRNDV